MQNLCANYVVLWKQKLKPESFQQDRTAGYNIVKNKLKEKSERNKTFNVLLRQAHR